MASAIFTHRIPFSLNNSKCENSVKWATWSRRRRREHVVDQTEKAGVSWDLFFGAYHFCSIKTVDLATNRCCQHHCWPPTRVLPTPDKSVANQLFGQKNFAKKYFFFLWQQFREKKIGCQHSHQGSTMTSTTSIGCQIHSFDATKMVCTKK